MSKSIAPWLVAAVMASGIGTATPASADQVKWPLPVGSYSQTCEDIAFKADNRASIKASCGKKSGSGKYYTTLNVIDCKPGSIGNYDGTLKCEHDEANAALYYSLANKTALEAGAVIVMGRAGSQADQVKWMLFALKQPDMVAAIKGQTLQFSDAALALRKYLTQQASLGEAQDVVRAAYQQAYGQPMGAIFFENDKANAVKSGKSWYSTLVLDFKKQKAAPVKPTGPTPPAPPIN